MKLRSLIASGLLVLMPLASYAAGLPEDSIYQLATPLTLQDGKAAQLDLARGQPTIISMFYGSCPHVCPALIATIRQMEKGLTAAQRGKLRVLMVSIDPERDTPEHLRQVAERNRVDLSRWSLARTSAGEVRKLAAVLGIQYRRLADGDYNHSTVISLLDGDGRILAQTSMLGRVDPQFLSKVSAATAD